MAEATSDEARFELLYRETFRPVLRYALARVDAERAKDVVAETFLVAWRRLAEVPGEPLPWLFGVARRVIAGQVRSDSRRRALDARLQLVAGGGGRGGATSSAPGDLAEGVVERDRVLAAFGRLGERDKEVLRLVTWDELDGGGAAEVLGVSRLTFAVRLHRARRRLAAELAVEDSLPSDDLPEAPGERRDPQEGRHDARSNRA